MTETAWYEKYLGKPWVKSPCPPHSFNCGELVRHVFLDVHGIDSAIIPIPEEWTYKNSIRAMLPERYGLARLPIDAGIQDFDVCFLGKSSRYIDHVGIAVHTLDGLLILHCQEGHGVTLDSQSDFSEIGYSKKSWYRHTAFLKAQH